MRLSSASLAPLRVLKGVNRPNQFGLPAAAVAVAVLWMASLGLGAFRPVRAMPATAHRFFDYMRAIDQSGQNLGFWDKLTYSLILAGPNPRRPAAPVVARARL